MEQERFEDDRTPGDLIECFSRCANFPRTVEGIQFLAQGLAKASSDTGVPMQVIVDACAKASQYCPTDHELLNVGRNIRDELQRQIESKRDLHAEWERLYGPAKAFDWKAEAAKIMPAAKEYWAKDKEAIALMKREAIKRSTTLQKMGYQERFKLHMWAQEQVGIPQTPEQTKELARLS